MRIIFQKSSQFSFKNIREFSTKHSKKISQKFFRNKLPHDSHRPANDAKSSNSDLAVRCHSSRDSFIQ